MYKRIFFLALVCSGLLLLLLGYKLFRFQTSQTYFDNLEEALQHPQQVRVLIIRNLEMDSLPMRISELTNLRVLNCANNNLTSLPETIGKLHNLEQLDCENNRIATLPVSVTQLKRLKEINLSKNQLRDLPKALFSLDSLQKLNLAGNIIARADMSGPAGLIEVDFSDNVILEVTPSIGRIRSLRKLDFYNNKLTNLPTCVFSLPLLVELVLLKNPLTDSTKALYGKFLSEQGSQQQPDTL